MCNIIAKKIIISTSWWAVLAAAPKATPSAAECTTKPIVAVTPWETPFNELSMSVREAEGTHQLFSEN